MSVHAPPRHVSVKLEEREKFFVMRRRAQLTQEDVSRLSGVSRVYLAGWENGARLLRQDQIDALWASLEEPAGEVA